MNLSRKHDEKKNFISRGLQSSKYGSHCRKQRSLSPYLCKQQNHRSVSIMWSFFHFHFYFDLIVMPVACCVTTSTLMRPCRQRHSARFLLMLFHMRIGMCSVALRHMCVSMHAAAAHACEHARSNLARMSAIFPLSLYNMYNNGVFFSHSHCIRLLR